MLVFLGLLLAGGYPGAEPSSQASSPWLMNLLDEGRVVSGTSGAMSDREEIVWECSQTAPQPLTTHSERTTERGDVRARMDGLKMIEEHRLTLTNRDSKYVQVGRNDMKTLHHMVAAVGAVTSGETGFASGVSALAIMSALRHGGRHVGIDPFQGAYSYDGLRAANGYAAKKALTFRHINETASMAVAWLHTQRVCFDAFFIDDGHKFDDIIVELFHVAKMLSFGGVLMLHDNWMPSVQKVQGFISANMPSLQEVTNPLGFKCCITIYTKTKHDERAWNHFRPF